MPALGVVLLSLVIHHITVVTGEECSAPLQTLTFECNDLCDEYHPCITYNGNAVGGTCGGENLSAISTCVTTNWDYSCDWECFGVDAQKPQNYTAFTFYIPFGTWDSTQEKEMDSKNETWSEEAARLEKQVVDAAYPWKNDDDLEKIDTLNLPDTCEDVVIVGGASMENLKGKVANVEFASDLLSNNQYVGNVSIMNLKLESATDSIAAMLPVDITSLRLTNVLLSSAPTNMKILTGLKTLYLDLNYITSFTDVNAASSLTVLSIYGNNLTNFDASLPNIESLDLSSNALEKIPDAIYNFTKLSSLGYDVGSSLLENPLKSPIISTSQYEFLNKLPNFELPNFSDELSCDTSKQQTLGNDVTICVLDDTPSASGSSASSSSSSNSAALIGGIAGGVIVLGVIISAVFWLHKRRSQGDKDEVMRAAYASDQTPSRSKTVLFAGNNSGDSGGNSRSQSSTVALAHSISIWNDAVLLSVKVNQDDIEDIKQIGNGAYGVVWLVRYRQSQLLASKRLVKSITDDESTRSRTQDFIQEIKLAAKLEHPNIVAFIGAAWTMEADLQALFEYMDNGDLRTYLIDTQNENRQPIWSQEKLQIAIDVIDGLVYLHSFLPPLVHRDLKSRNVLLTNELRAKLTDFGVSRYRSEDNTMTVGVGTGKWLAPEVISGRNDYDQAADIFSYGVVLSELDTHQLPYSNTCGASGNPLPDVAVLQMVALGKLVPSFSSTCPEKLLELAKQCLSHDPRDRPTAAQVAYSLRTIQKQMYTTL